MSDSPTTDAAFREECLEAALRYAAAGVPVFPCIAGTKYPAVQHGYLAATTDPEQIRAWWAEEPDYNVAIVPGRAGWTVLDVDPRHDGPNTLAALESAWGDATDTLMVSTPSGGAHYYFEGATPRNTAGKLGGLKTPGLDTRSERGYVLAPPSRTPQGVYSAANDLPIRPIPAELKKALAKPTRKSHAAAGKLDLPVNVERFEDYAMRLPGAVEGTRNEEGAKLIAVGLDMGLTPETVWRVVHGLWGVRCMPPLAGDDKLRESGMFERRQNEGHPLALSGTAAEVLGPQAEAWAKDHPQAAPEPVAASVEVWTHTDHMARSVGAVAELEPGWIERGTAHQISAPGGKHKSRLLLQAGLGMGAGKGMFCNRQHEPIPFVFYSYEDGPDEVSRRVQAISRRFGIAPGGADFRHVNLYGRSLPMLAVTEQGELTVTDYGAAQLDYLREIPGHKFVGIDGLYNAVRFQGRAKIAEEPVIAALGWLEALGGEADATLAYVFHPTYAGQGRGDGSGFSIAFHNFPRVRLQLVSPNAESDDTVELSMPKRNHGARAKPLTLHWSGGALLPRSSVSEDDYAAKFRDACVKAAIEAANTGQPIQVQRPADDWVIDAIAGVIGHKPTQREVKQELASALRAGQLSRKPNAHKKPAGYYPPIDAGGDIA